MNEQTEWKITKRVNCDTKNIVYMISCSECKERYIGETRRSLKDRLSDHRGYINNQKLNYITRQHFNQPGHSLSKLKITIIEKQKSEDDSYRKERERYFINKFNTFYKGMNRQT